MSDKATWNDGFAKGLGCQCPKFWSGVLPPPCPLHNPAQGTITTTGTNNPAAPAPLDGLRAALLAEGIEAFRLTREYVGEDTLPALPGWSWFDWTEKALAALLAIEAEAAPHPLDGLTVERLARAMHNAGFHHPSDEGSCSEDGAERILAAIRDEGGDDVNDQDEYRVEAGLEYQMTAARVVTGGLPDPMDNRTEQLALDALREVMAINHSPFLGSDGIRPCLCVVHEDARATLRDEGETT